LEARARRAAVFRNRRNLAPPQSCAPGRATLRSGRSTTGSEGPFPRRCRKGRADEKVPRGTKRPRPPCIDGENGGDALPPPSPRAARDVGGPFRRRRGWRGQEKATTALGFGIVPLHAQGRARRARGKKAAVPSVFTTRMRSAFGMVLEGRISLF
jgi:hypothetical protein